jgi:CHASE2 domain-containing sensor protein
MPHNDPRPQQGRHAFLSVLLTVLAVGFVLLALIFVSGGFFLYVVLFGGAILLVALMHYVLWGRAFSSQVAGEREEELLRQRAAEIEPDDDWQPPDTRIRR